jgi:hypothetical protein
VGEEWVQQPCLAKFCDGVNGGYIFEWLQAAIKINASDIFCGMSLRKMSIQISARQISLLSL